MDLLVDNFELSTELTLDEFSEGEVIEWISVKVSNDEVTKIKITIHTPNPSEMSTSKS
jgi:hypothetical protein